MSSSSEDEEKVQAALLLNADPHQPIILYTRRWAMLLIYLCMYFANVIMGYSFASLETMVSEYYGVDIFMVNTLILVIYIVEIPGLFVAVWFLQKKGLRNTILLAGVFQCVGGGIRVIGGLNNMFPAMFAGQCIIAMAQPFLDASPTKVAANWFGEKERTVAVSIYAVALSVTIALLSFLAPRLVKHNSDIFWYVVLQGAFTAFSFLMVLVFFRTSPPTPPSSAASVARESVRDSFVNIWKSQSFVILCIGFGTLLGAYQTLFTLLVEIVAPLGYNQGAAGLFSGTIIVAGLFGTIGAGILSDMTKAYKAILFVGSGGAALGLLALSLIFSFLPKAEWLILIMCGTTGFFALAAYPTALEVAVEFTFPISEQFSAASMVVFANVLTVGFTYALTIVLEDVGSATVMYSLAGTAIFCFILIGFLKPDYRRLKYETEQNALKQEY